MSERHPRGYFFWTGKMYGNTISVVYMHRSLWPHSGTIWIWCFAPSLSLTNFANASPRARRVRSAAARRAGGQLIANGRIPIQAIAASIEAELADEEGVSVDEVLVADASRRTTALNTYVSGLGSTRRIVVYDTLLERDGKTQVWIVEKQAGTPDAKVTLRDVVAEARGRDRTPVLVGGSALYTRAIVDRFE